MLEIRVQLALTIVWFLLFVPAVLWWKDSVPFLVFVSVYANFVGHLSAWEAARAKEEAHVETDGTRPAAGERNGSPDQKGEEDSAGM